MAKDTAYFIVWSCIDVITSLAIDRISPYIPSCSDWYACVAHGVYAMQLHGPGQLVYEMCQHVDFTVQFDHLESDNTAWSCWCDY